VNRLTAARLLTTAIIAISAGAVTGLIVMLIRAPAGTVETPRLEGALRAGALEFERYRERLVLDKPVAATSLRATGGVVVELKTIVRNETGHRLHGLEMRGVLTNGQGARLGERVAVIIPQQQALLEPGEEIKVHLVVEGVNPDAQHTDARLEVTGLRFE